MPTNQDIDVTVLADPPGFQYVATVKKPDWGLLTIINHHGSAYVKSKALWLLRAGTSWPEFYRELRFWGKDERVRLVNGNTSLIKLRKL